MDTEHESKVISSKMETHSSSTFDAKNKAVYPIQRMWQYSDLPGELFWKDAKKSKEFPLLSSSTKFNYYLELESELDASSLSHCVHITSLNKKHNSYLQYRMFVCSNKDNNQNIKNIKELTYRLPIGGKYRKPKTGVPVRCFSHTLLVEQLVGQVSILHFCIVHSWDLFREACITS